MFLLKDALDAMCAVASLMLLVGMNSIFVRI